jgi:hypothetical protein
MGKILKILKKLHEMDDKDLLSRFEHLIAAKSIREYLDKKEDLDLILEIRLAREEIFKRMPAELPLSGL